MTQRKLLYHGDVQWLRLYIESRRLDFERGRKHEAGGYQRVSDRRKTELELKIESDLGGKYYEISLEGPGSWACFEEYLSKRRRERAV